MLVVNNQSPGPTIEANFGDRIIVNIINNLPNATSIHWHGQRQNGTNYYDGTFGITQCGIPPNGGSMTYNFTIQNIGTYWWHAHKSTQYTDGLYGSMILHSPDETARKLVPYDREVIVMIGDYYSTFTQELVWRYLRFGTGIDGQPGDEPVGDGGIFNGISQAHCAFVPATNSTPPERRHEHGKPMYSAKSIAGWKRYPGGMFDQAVIPEYFTCVDDPPKYASLELSQGMTYRFRLINIGGFPAMRFSIDGHPLTIVEADGVAVEPWTVDHVLVDVAQRYSVVVTLNKTAGAYWMRADIETHRFRYLPPIFNSTTLAVLRYGIDSSTMPPDEVAPDISSEVLQSFDINHDLVPADKMTAPPATRQISVFVSMQFDTLGNFLSFFDNVSWEPLMDSATLYNLYRDPSYFNQDNLIHKINVVQTVDLIVNSYDDGDHPFHLHGHEFFIVGQGVGSYTDQTLNIDNPMRRDTVLLPAFSWIVLRFTADNPGLWAFHCHITWHMETGLMMQIASLAGLEKLVIPDELRAFCAK